MERKHKISLEFADGRTLTFTTKHQVKLVVEPHMESVMTAVHEENGRTHVLPLPVIEGFHARIEFDVEKGELEKNFAEGFPIKPEDKLRFTEVKKSFEEKAKEIGGSDENRRTEEVQKEH